MSEVPLYTVLVSITSQEGLSLEDRKRTIQTSKTRSEWPDVISSIKVLSLLNAGYMARYKQSSACEADHCRVVHVVNKCIDPEAVIESARYKHRKHVLNAGYMARYKQSSACEAVAQYGEVRRTPPMFRVIRYTTDPPRVWPSALVKAGKVLSRA